MPRDRGQRPRLQEMLLERARLRSASYGAVRPVALPQAKELASVWVLLLVPGRQRQELVQRL